jgi:hypothetical protein
MHSLSVTWEARVTNGDSQKKFFWNPFVQSELKFEKLISLSQLFQRIFCLGAEKNIIGLPLTLSPKRIRLALLLSSPFGSLGAHSIPVLAIHAGDLSSEAAFVRIYRGAQLLQAPRPV